MREILFRGKNVDNGAWVYGSLLIQSGEWISKDEQAPTEYRILGCRGENYLAIPETVGQYTGLTDKNGTKIFEGDIMRVRYQTGEVEVGVVWWSENGAKWIFGFTDGYDIDLTEQFQVIGSVHD